MLERSTWLVGWRGGYWDWDEERGVGEKEKGEDGRLDIINSTTHGTSRSSRNYLRYDQENLMTSHSLSHTLTMLQKNDDKKRPGEIQRLIHCKKRNPH